MAKKGNVKRFLADTTLLFLRVQEELKSEKYVRATVSVLRLCLWFGVAWALIYVTVFTSVSPTCRSSQSVPSVPSYR